MDKMSEIEVARLRADLKDALTEIENRGRSIAALSEIARGLAALVNDLAFPSDAKFPPEELTKKVKQTLLSARGFGLF